MVIEGEYFCEYTQKVAKLNAGCYIWFGNLMDCFKWRLVIFTVFTLQRLKYC